MAKTSKNKSKVKNQISVKKVRFDDRIKKKKDNFKLKECIVKLDKMKNSFVQRWLNPPGASFSFNIAIKNNVFKINGTEIEPVAPSVYDICLKISRGEISMEKTIEKNIEMKTSSTGIQTKQCITKTIIQLVNENWVQTKREKKSSKILLKENDLIMGKMKGYSPWPGKIICFSKNRKSAQVYFYGTHNQGSVLEAEMTLFQYSHDVIRLQLLRPLLIDFRKGIREAEIEMQIPDELSITREQRSLN